MDSLKFLQEYVRPETVIDSQLMYDVDFEDIKDALLQVADIDHPLPFLKSHEGFTIEEFIYYYEEL